MSFYAEIIANQSAGMGSIFNSTIQGLADILKFGGDIAPVIIWDLPIYSDHGFDVFDIFFELVNFPRMDDGLDRQYIWADTREFVYPPNYSRRETLNSIFLKHIRVRPIITRTVDTILKDLDDHFLMGVHVRNTDRRLELKESFIEINPLIKHLLIAIGDEYKSHEKIALFVASDNIPDADLVKKSVLESFPNIKIIEDPYAMRSPCHISVHGTHDGGIVGVSKFKKARSILNDIFCLARCSVVVRTNSNVTASSAIINLRTRYIDVSKIYGKNMDDWVTE